MELDTEFSLGLFGQQCKCSNPQPVRAVNAYSHRCGVCGSERACVYVCVVQFASNKPFTMRARSVNATLYSPGLVCVSLLCVCCVLCAVRCLLLGVAVTQPLTTIPYPVFRCRCLCLCYFQSRCIPIARASWLCQL